MTPHDYQLAAKQFVLQSLARRSGAGLWLDCGLGKTAISLLAIKDMLSLGFIRNVGIIAPKRVISTAWPKEIKQWGFDMSWSWLCGDEEQRQSELERNTDIQFINCENLAVRNFASKDNEPGREQLAVWLRRIKWKRDLLVIDESTKFKNWSASRSKVLRHFLKSEPKTITLTGTPMPNTMADIFSQQFILDRGRTLSPYITNFRDRFMRRCGYKNYDWEMRPEMADELKRLIAPWYLHQSALDHLDMPELIHNPIDVALPEKVLAAYKDMEKQMYAEFDSGSLIAMNSGSKYGVCRQIASGNAYGEGRKAISIHDAKLDALEDLWEELSYKPILVAYWYQHEFERIKKRFPKCEVINGSTSSQKVGQIISGWQRGTVPMVVAQAGTISHGVDGLQKGGNDLCWFTLTDQPEIRYQLERRIFRQGVKGNQVRIHYLLAESTVDRTIYKALNAKGATEKSVIEAVRAMRGSKCTVS